MQSKNIRARSDGLMMQRWPMGRGEHIPNNIYPGSGGEWKGWGANTFAGNRDVRCIFASPETRIETATEIQIHQKCPLHESNTEKTLPRETTTTKKKKRKKRD